jgi:hypothetical protein
VIERSVDKAHASSNAHERLGYQPGHHPGAQDNRPLASQSAVGQFGRTLGGEHRR